MVNNKAKKLLAILIVIFCEVLAINMALLWDVPNWSRWALVVLGLCLGAVALIVSLKSISEDKNNGL